MNHDKISSEVLPSAMNDFILLHTRVCFWRARRFKKY